MAESRRSIRRNLAFYVRQNNSRFCILMYVCDTSLMSAQNFVLKQPLDNCAKMVTLFSAFMRFSNVYFFTCSPLFLCSSRMQHNKDVSFTEGHFFKRFFLALIRCMAVRVTECTTRGWEIHRRWFYWRSWSKSSKTGDCLTMRRPSVTGSSTASHSYRLLLRAVFSLNVGKIVVHNATFCLLIASSIPEIFTIKAGPKVVCFATQNVQ